MHKNILLIMWLALCAISCLPYGCAQKQPPEPLSETRLLLDTVCTITIYDSADPALLTETLDLCAAYESLFSRTVEGSDIWRLNHAGGAPVTVDAATVELLRAGLFYGDFSGGMFDITIGRLSALWDFGGIAAVPAAEELAAARETTDYRRIDIAGDTVQMANAEAWLDLGGIAKGYIADMLAAFLKERGVKSAVIDLGGNIVTVGLKPGDNLWRIGVEQPFSGSSKLVGVLNTGEASIVTSGIYERQFIENGVLYHHILDPGAGMPVKSDVISVTVVSESSMVGDALSTIILLLGSEKAAALLEQVPGLMGVVLMLENGELLQYGDIDFHAAIK
ncbi:MAG: FAD:protein FMN transferase [Clostridiales bacterium]|nr:FAD:protein FMN transferase [Clostridiales bacterium]